MLALQAHSVFTPLREVIPANLHAVLPLPCTALLLVYFCSDRVQFLLKPTHVGSLPGLGLKQTAYCVMQVVKLGSCLSILINNLAVEGRSPR